MDDAHLLDELSALLVYQLVLRRAASVVLMLRSGESAPDAVTARCSPTATHLAGCGLAMACGRMGRLERVEQALRRIEASVESFNSGLHEAVAVAFYWLRGLLLAACRSTPNLACALG